MADLLIREWLSNGLIDQAEFVRWRTIFQTGRECINQHHTLEQFEEYMSEEND